MWNDHLVRELAARRVIIFLGAGVSMTAKNATGARLPSWEELLRSMASKIENSETRARALKFITNNQLLNAAELAISAIDPGVKSNFYRETFASPRFEPSEIHHAIHQLDAKIVVTTNFDLLYDGLCPPTHGFSIRKYSDNSIVDDLRSSSRLFVKAHGCVTDARSMVLSRSDYYRVRNQHSAFYRILDALFLTNTVLFIGCSLTDPDIQLTLENVAIAAPAEHSHFALMPSGMHQSELLAIKNTFNIKVVEYDNSSNDFSNFQPAVQSLVERVNSFRVTFPT